MLQCFNVKNFLTLILIIVILKYKNEIIILNKSWFCYYILLYLICSINFIKNQDDRFYKYPLYSAANVKSENLGQKMKEDHALDFLYCFFAKSSFDNE